MSDTTAVSPIPEEKTPEAKAHRAMKVQEYALPVVVVGLCILGALISDRFATTANFENILIQASIGGIIAVGMTFVIATGGIDLSVGSILAASAIFGALLGTGGTYTVPFGDNPEIVFSELGVWGFLIGTLLFGALLGAINGLAISWLRILPFIATLAMMTIGRGLALNLSGKSPISLSEFETLSTIGRNDWLGIPIPAFVFLVTVVIGWFLLNRTRYGRYVIAVGGNREAARIAGIRVRQILFSVYVLVGVCAGIAAIVLSGQLASAAPTNGNMLELQAIAAVAIGGTALIGGRATMVGTFLGVLTFAIIFNLLTLMGLPIELQQIAQGLIILVAVAVQRRKD